MRQPSRHRGLRPSHKPPKPSRKEPIIAHSVAVTVGVEVPIRLVPIIAAAVAVKAAAEVVKVATAVVAAAAEVPRRHRRLHRAVVGVEDTLQRHPYRTT